MKIQMEDGHIMSMSMRVVLLSLSIVPFLPSAGAQQLGSAPAQPALSVIVPVVTTSGTSASVSTCCGGIMTTIAGNGTAGNTGDGGPASAALVSAGLRGIEADASGDVFFVDDTNATVRVVYQGGAIAAKLISAENPLVTAPVVGDIYVIAGVEGSTGTPTNGVLGTTAHLTPGAGLGLDAAGDVYFNDTASNKIWVIYAGGTGTTGTNFISLEAGVTAPLLGAIYAIAGNSTAVGYAGDGSLATASGVKLYGVNDMKFDAAGDMFFVDNGNNAVREVNAKTGVLSTFAGGNSGAGTAGNTGLNGPATAALLSAPYGIAVDASGDVYIADKGNASLKLVYEGGAQAQALITIENSTVMSPTLGDIYLIAGKGSKTSPYGYLGTASSLNAPTMVALDAAGDIYIADNGYNVIQEINPATGIMVTVAGNTTKGYGGDGGLANSAEMNSPRCVAVDANGRLYITDAGNDRVREISQGIMSFVGQAAGTTSAPELLQLVNTGNATLNFTGTPAIAGTNGNDFALDTSSSLNTCTLGSLAAGATCNLAITYAPTNSGTSSATLTFATNDSLGSQVVQLQGQPTPAPVALAASATTAYPGEVVTLTAVVQSPGGTPTGSVSFYQGTTLVQTVTLPSLGTVTITLPALNIGSYSYTATYSGDMNFAGSTSAVVPVSVDDFSISASATTLTVVPGQANSLTLTITGAGPLAQTLSLSCTAPSILGCSFTPSSAALAIGGTAIVTVSVAAVATTTDAIKTQPRGYVLAFLPLGLVLLIGVSARRRSRLSIVASLLCLASLGLLSGCAQNNIGKPLPASTQTVTLNVSATGGSTTFTQSVNLTVNVQ